MQANTVDTTTVQLELVHEFQKYFAKSFEHLKSDYMGMDPLAEEHERRGLHPADALTGDGGRRDGNHHDGAHLRGGHQRLFDGHQAKAARVVRVGRHADGMRV